MTQDKCLDGPVIVVDNAVMRNEDVTVDVVRKRTRSYPRSCFREYDMVTSRTFAGLALRNLQAGPPVNMAEVIGGGIAEIRGGV